MSRLVNCMEEVVIVSKGKEDIGKLVALGEGGKLDSSVILTEVMGNFVGTAATYAAISTTYTSPSNNDLVIVFADENYSNVSTVYIYSSSSSAWVLSGKFSGSASSDGTVWYSGSGTPSSDTGNDGDYYLDTADCDVYKKTSGSWAVICNIKGETGAAGTAGETGATGAQGEKGDTGSNGASGNLAPDWAADTAYLLNQLCMYNGVLYRCTTAHTSGTSFDSGYFSSIAGPYNYNDFRNVVSTVTGNTAATITATYCPYTQASISLTLSMSTTGANALDNGTVAASTWYYTYVIYNPTTNTVACLASNSSTTPTLPSGYTYYCRVGAILTNSSSYLYRIIQKGRDAGYIVDGTILTGLRQMATGVTGSVSTPTWVAVSVSGFVPPTASTIDILIPNIASTSQTMVAPNANYGAWNSVTNPPPISIGDSATATQLGGWGRIILESTNIYWANNASATGYGIFCKGYTDNL